MKKTLIDFILKEKLIDPLALDALKKESKEKGLPLEEHILNKGAVKEEDFYRAKAKFLKVPFKRPTGKTIELNGFKLIPIEAAQHYRFVPLSIASNCRRNRPRKSIFTILSHEEK